MALNQDVAFKITAEVTGQQAVDKLSQSLKNMGNQGEVSARQMAWAMRMVPAQLTDITTGLLTGQSAMTVFIQQGGQLRDMFGSFGAMATGVGRVVAGLITPMNTLAAIAGAVGFAFYKGADESQELNRQLLITGGAAGYTAGQIEKMAASLRNVQGISAGTARDLVTGLAASGQFVGKNLETAAEAAAKLGKLTGESSDSIVKDFSKMSSGVASWAAEHNKTMNFLSLAQFQYIQRLEQMGKKEEAIAAAIKALDDTLDGRRRNLGYLEASWKAVSDAISGAWDAMKKWGREETGAEQIARLRKQLEALEKINPNNRLLTGAFSPGVNAEAQKAFEENKARILKQIADLEKVENEAASKAKTQAETRQKIEDELSGKANATRSARLALELAQMEGASQARIALLEQEKTKLEAMHSAGLVGEDAFIKERLRIQKAELAEREAMIDREIAIEKRRPITSQADAVNQQARIQQLKNQRAQLSSSGAEAEIKAQGELYQRTFNSGVMQAMKEYVDVTANAANQAKTLFTNAFKGMEDALVKFVKTGKLDFSSLADSIITDMIRISVQQSITGPLAMAMGSYMNAKYTPGSSSFVGPMPATSAMGNIVGPGGTIDLKTYANGGVAKRPQLSIFGEGSTPEAYVPLPDGRSIPVSMRGAGGSSVVVNITNNTDGKATATERTGTNGVRIVDVIIEQVKNSIAGDIARGSGVVPSAIERTYGANRAAGAY